jgi:hypothetical protein
MSAWEGINALLITLRRQKMNTEKLSSPFLAISPEGYPCLSREGRTQKEKISKLISSPGLLRWACKEWSLYLFLLAGVGMMTMLSLKHYWWGAVVLVVAGVYSVVLADKLHKRREKKLRELLGPNHEVLGALRTARDPLVDDIERILYDLW